MTERPLKSYSVRPVAVVALGLALALVVAFAMAAFWAVDRIDARELSKERQSIAAGLDARKQRIGLEQDSSAAWDDAVVNLRANDQSWLAENLAEWMSEFFAHDRIYLLAPGDHVVRAAEAGAARPAEIDARDRPVVMRMADSLRQLMATASEGLVDSTPAISGMGLVEAVRLEDGQLAFVSIRPVVPTSGSLTQSPGEEFLHASVVLLNGRVLDELGRQAGLPDLRVGGPARDRAALPVLNNRGNTIGYVVWTPKKPAMMLLRETAPATVGLLLLGSLSVGGLLMWLRRTTARLQESQDRIFFLAYHDPLTGVANRALFEVRLREALAHEYLSSARVALVSIDLDRFKEINDTLGHAAGDQLIRLVARRLTGKLPEEATLTRLGGDEFALVHPGMVSDGHARFLCQTLLDSFRDPFVVSDQMVHVTVSMGVVLEAGSDITPAEMMHRADVALYAAKEAGRNCFQLYDPTMDQQRRDSRTLEVDLRNALIKGEGLYLLYQPIYDAQSGGIVGAEALVRWHHPVRGHLSPDTFIGIAEDRGIIGELGMWVLNEACRFISSSELPWVAVNVSPLQFNDEAFADRVLCLLSQWALPAGRLELEITEGLLLQNSPEVRNTLAKLRQAGIRIALDDFGTGYSSISHLQSHEVDKLKIDQSFTRLIGQDKTAATIVRSIIEMARALDIGVTAEGVEDDRQRLLLRELGCSSLQGYHLSRPVPGDRLLDLVALAEQPGVSHLPRQARPNP